MVSVRKKDTAFFVPFNANWLGFNEKAKRSGINSREQNRFTTNSFSAYRSADELKGGGENRPFRRGNEPSSFLRERRVNSRSEYAKHDAAHLETARGGAIGPSIRDRSDQGSINGPDRGPVDRRGRRGRERRRSTALHRDRATESRRLAVQLFEDSVFRLYHVPLQGRGAIGAVPNGPHVRLEFPSRGIRRSAHVNFDAFNALPPIQVRLPQISVPARRTLVPGQHLREQGQPRQDTQ